MKNLDFRWVAGLVGACVLLLGASYFIFMHAEREINRGLDIAGGVYVLLEAVDIDEEEAPHEALDRAITIIQHRVDELGVVEPLIQRQGDRRIRVELPGYEDEETARDVIGRTARLSFQGPDGEELLTGEHLDNASAQRNPRDNQPMVMLEFDPEGAELFEEATGRFLGEQITIMLDEEVLSAPVVQEVIPGGTARIDGIGDMDEAGYLATMLRSGALPVDLEEREFRMVGPTLGERTEEIGIWAAAIGLLAVLLFMIFYYRSLGVLAAVTLVFYLGLVLGILTWLNATLTLPGIAGLILSIGMAVDANVLIFERIKEGLKERKTMMASIESGFSNALSAILDANVTTLIAAIVLFAMTTGPVRGFAVTLFIGIICSLLTALIITRLMLRLGLRGKVLRTGPSVGVKVK